MSRTHGIGALHLHFGKWSGELGIEAAKDSRFVYAEAEYVTTESCNELIGLNDFMKAWQGAGDSVIAH